MKAINNKAVIGNRFVSSLKPHNKPYEIRDQKLTGFLLRVQPSGIMTYICQYARGKRITIGKTDVLTPVQAREQAKKILADAVRGIDPMAEKRKQKEYSLKTYLADVYGPWAENHHRNGPATIARLKANFLADFGNKKLPEISAWSIEKWRSSRLKNGTRPATVNRDINALKAALSRAVQWGFLDGNPLASVKPIKVDGASRVRFLYDEEEHALRSALDKREEHIRRERDSANAWREIRSYEQLPDLRRVPFVDHLKPMVLLCINTGCRRGELFNLCWDDVNLARAMLTVKGEGAKSGQTRHVPLNEEALNTLRNWRMQSQNNELVFPSQNGERLTNIKSSWNKLLKDANIADFRFHDLRHHFASRLVMAGVDLNTVRELLGHGDIKMTLRYAHLAPEIKANAVARLERKVAANDVKVSKY